MMLVVLRTICATGLLLAALGLPGRAETLRLDDSELRVEMKFRTTTYWLVYGFDALWGMEPDRLVRIDPVDNSVTRITIPGYKGRNRGLGLGEGAIWIPDIGTDRIFKVDPVTHEVLLKIEVDLLDISPREGGIGLGEGSVWIPTVADRKGWMVRFDAMTGKEQARIQLPPATAGMVFAHGSLWAAATYKDVVYRIDPATNAIAATIPASGTPKQIAAGEAGIWVLAQEGGLVHHIDPTSDTVVASFDTETSAEDHGDITTGGGYVWVTYRNQPLVQIDPRTDTMMRIYRGTDVPGDAIRFGAGSLWISAWGSNIYRLTPPE